MVRLSSARVPVAPYGFGSALTAAARHGLCTRGVRGATASASPSWG